MCEEVFRSYVEIFFENYKWNISITRNFSNMNRNCFEILWLFLNERKWILFIILINEDDWEEEIIENLKLQQTTKT